ncbi:hypothetical protein N665_0047s0021 [Sinapis alba]|nr:hypothetical protein N665_0047s0021 [Sinapis alba]
MQDENVIAYGSRQLRKHKENYPTNDLEMAAMLFALKMRWLKFITDYNLQIQCHPWKANVIANALSQRMSDTTIDKDLETLEAEFKMVNLSAIEGEGRANDTIWVVEDQLTKTAHFLPIRIGDKVEVLGELYLKEIIILHEVSANIVFDRDSRFTAQFQKTFQEALKTNIPMSTAFHPETD